ncbi:MAG: sarcosine oxidase subunit gamma [Dongiaceae bacterium]
MAEPYLRRSPLAHRGLAAKAAADTGGAEFIMGERAHRLQIDLRGDLDDAVFTAAVHGATGLRLPAEANRFSVAGDLAGLWLGPNEWLVTGPRGREADMTARLLTAFAATHAAAIDVSEARTVIVAAGPRARDVLAKGISLDLHPRLFGPGHCAQTGLAGANIILRQLDSVPSFDIHVLDSFAEHLWQWLEGAAREFRIAVRSFS